MKTCTKCKLEKNLECFGKHAKNKDGLRVWCKSCCAEYDRSIRKIKTKNQRNRREANRDEFNNKQREYRLSEKGRAKDDKYNRSDKGKVAKAKSFKRFYDKNKERLLAGKRSSEGRAYMREYMKEYAKQEKVKAYRRLYKKTPECQGKDKERRKKNYKKDPGKFKALVALRRARVEQATPSWVSLKVLLDIYRACPEGHDVDHVIPLKNPNVCGLHVPWNLQYLTEHDNSSKKNKFDGTYENESWRNLVR